MSDRKSPPKACPLDSVWQKGAAGRMGASGITMRRVTPGAIALLTHWPGMASKLEVALKGLQGKLFPTEPALSLPGPSMRNANSSLALSDLGGGRILLECADTQWEELHPILIKHIVTDIAVCTNLSDARVILELTGPSVEWVLLKCMPLDVSAKALPENQVAQSNMHHMPVILTRAGAECFHLQFFASYATSCYELLCHAAEEVGIERL